MHRFPNTFYKVRGRPPILQSNQDLYITSYAQAMGDLQEQGGGWEVIFENGRLIKFEFGKG